MHLRTLVDKEWAEVFQNRMVLLTVALLPLVLLAVSVAQLMLQLPARQLASAAPPGVLAELCRQQALGGSDCLQSILAGQSLLLLLMLPLIIPMTIACQSIVGEKVTRSLEPLLATPISTFEIILGKGLAAALPAIAASWLSFSAYRLIAWSVASARVYTLIADVKWLVAMLLLAPLLAVLSVNIAVMISSRVNDPRGAQQLGMLLVLPLLALMLSPLLGWGTLTLGSVLLLAAVLLVADAALLVVAVRLFAREAILTRWR